LRLAIILGYNRRPLYGGEKRKVYPVKEGKTRRLMGELQGGFRHESAEGSELPGGEKGPGKEKMCWRERGKQCAKPRSRL